MKFHWKIVQNQEDRIKQILRSEGVCKRLIREVLWGSSTRESGRQDRDG